MRQGRVIPLASSEVSACTCLFVARCCQRAEPQCGELPVDWAVREREGDLALIVHSQTPSTLFFFVLVIVSSNDQLLTI